MSLFIFPIIFPLIPTVIANDSISQIMMDNSPKTTSSLEILHDSSFKTSTIDRVSEDNPEAYFPNFLHYSVITANALIDYLYDSEEGGFYRSADEHWSEPSINSEKRTYDQAQAILALLKLSQAVINETQREYALNIAEETGKFMISDLYDVDFGGFFSSTGDRFKRPGIEGKAIEALIALFDTTGNTTYIDIAKETFEFVNTNGWDRFEGGYYYKLSHSGVVASPNLDELYQPDSKRVDHNTLMGSALIDLYTLTDDPIYLDRAVEIYESMNSSCFNNDTGLFYGGYMSSGDVVDSDSSELIVNTLMVEFLAKLYNVTQKISYLDGITALIKSLLYNYWDDSFGGFYSTHLYSDTEDRDLKKYTERQFYAMRALDEAYKLTNNNLYYNLIFDMMEFLNTNLYDQDHEGYIQLSNENGDAGDPLWKNKFSVTQTLAIYELANLWLYSKPGVLNAMWLPSLPRPQDPVTIVVAAFDSDGVADVLCNYSVNNQPYSLVKMQMDTQVGNMYNTSFKSQPVGTTINFNIIVNDTLGNEAVRGSYFFIWQYDTWSPHVEVLGIDPGVEIPVYSEVSITVSVHDIPTQGSVSNVRIYYHLEGKPEDSKSLTRIDSHIWQVTFESGFNVPGTYAYYFEATDDRGNFGYTAVSNLYVLGKLATVPLVTVIGGLFIILLIAPAGFALFKEYQKRNAKRSLKQMKHAQGMKRRRTTRRTRRNRN
ncbi:MAG: AGE family epimerase/isomerase [Candidatus Kariarchaeaceae archaeon]|jgi:mannose/cellobiose epimerase-like protein (N-acyl-D-glucosamine 2-epimerase family)